MENKNETSQKKDEEIENNEKRKISNAHLRDNTKKRTSIYSRIYQNMKEETTKKKVKNISLNDLGNKEIQNLYVQLKKPYKRRSKKDNIEIYLFLLKTRIKENFKSDLLHTELNLDALFTFVNPYISVNIYNNGEILYSYGDDAEFFYLILKGSIGQFKLVETEVLLTSEDYYAYLWNKFEHLKNTMNVESQEENKNFDINENEYTDIELIRRMANINREIFPLYSFDDMEELNKIIIRAELYITMVENKRIDLNDTFTKFNVPLSYLNYENLLRFDISSHYFIQNLSKNIKEKEQFYMKYLGKNAEFKVKLLKYVKTDILKPYQYFGNFEMIDIKPVRIDTARCESDSTILITFNKKVYSKVINNIQKEKREKEILFLHNDFYFKILNKYYFEKKMFTKYKIDNFLKGNILINQGEIINKFIFVREGTVETSINNISLLELANKIKNLTDFILIKAKECNINAKDIIDFDISLDLNTNLEYELIEGILKQKQSFILFRTDKGCFGEYEYYFNTSSFVTETIISKNGKVYFYEYKNFKKVNEEIHVLNEVLKEISFSKLKSILKRMVTIYNSYFKFNIKQIETKIIENENSLKNANTSNSINIEGDLFVNSSQENVSSPIIIFKKNIRNIPNIINLKTENNNSKDSIDKIYSIKKIRGLNAFSNNVEKIRKFRQSTFSRIKTHLIKKNNNSFMNRDMDLRIKAKKNLKINLNCFSTDNSFKEKKVLTIIKKDKPIKTLINEIIAKNNNIKTEASNKKIPFDVFLPPLLKQKDKKNNNQKDNSNEKENVKINYHYFKNYVSIPNSINDASLGHKDKDNLNNNLKLSNLEEKKFNDLTKKSKSINIKKVQINRIKNRSKKFKLILQKKNEEDLLYERDIY